jgi:hypothetical protein
MVDIAGDIYEIRDSGLGLERMTANGIINRGQGKDHTQLDLKSVAETQIPGGTIVVDQARYILQLEDRVRALEQRLSAIEQDEGRCVLSTRNFT